jgi:hypothetical protein
MSEVIELLHLSCCPCCGGSSGYSYSRTETYTVNGSWGREEQAHYDGRPIKETKPRCADCNKIIRAT